MQGRETAPEAAIGQDARSDENQGLYLYPVGLTPSLGVANVALDIIHALNAWYRDLASPSWVLDQRRPTGLPSPEVGDVHPSSPDPRHATPKAEPIVRVVNLHKSFGPRYCSFLNAEEKDKILGKNLDDLFKFGARIAPNK